MKGICAILALVVGAMIALGSAANGSADPIPHQAGLSSPQTVVSQEWVRYMNNGNQRAACALQTVASVNGQACDALPTRQVLHCPKSSASQKPKRGSKSSARRKPVEQVGSITEEGAESAFAVLLSERKSSQAHGALGLARVAGTWRVSYLRQGEDTYVPAGTVWMSEAWRKLWVPPTCAR